MGNNTIFRCLKILRGAGKQEIFATNVPKILDLKSFSEQIFCENNNNDNNKVFIHQEIKIQTFCYK